MKINSVLKIFFVLLIGVYFAQGCRVDDKITPVVINENITLYWPPYFPTPIYNFENNTRTAEGIYLGRKLFYDPILSSDNTISCGSCHQQFVAFANADHKLSHGVNGLLGVRNTPALFNLMWQREFFWDGGAKHIELQPIGPITNPVEMNENFSNLLEKLRKNDAYVNLFKKAFKSDSITTQYMLKALAQFMGSIISCNSKYDTYLTDSLANPLSASEKSGLQIFTQKCATCHNSALFTDNSYKNNGLDENILDSGRYMITKINSDIGKFKVPTLRNIELTYPYMHDGRFETLEQVLEHYNSGIKQSNTLDATLLNGITLTTNNKINIIAFLKTLTDKTLVSNPNFSEVK